MRVTSDLRRVFEMTVLEQILLYPVDQKLFDQLVYLLLYVPVTTFVVARAFRDVIEFIGK